MGVFDLDTAVRSLGIGNSPVDSLGMAFGVPECLLSISKDVLNLLPTGALGSFADSIKEGKQAANNAIAYLANKVRLDSGIIEIDLENGSFRLFSDSSKNKLDNNLNNAAGTFGQISDAVGFALGVGTQLYTNYQNAANILNGVKDCLDSYKLYLDLQKGPSSSKRSTAEVLARYEVEIAQAREAREFIAKADRVLNDIGSILVERIKNPSLEPVFNTTSGVSTSSVVEEPVFRLVFGPPKSKSGQFLFSVDGLYYDSQTGGLPTVSGVLSIPDKYKFEYNANLGGKGEMVSLEDLNKYIDTIFDPDVVDDSLELQKHYEADHFLQVLLGQKHRNLDSISKKISELISQGYTEDSAMVINTKQQIQSVASQHNKKINKRKKQIEVAVKAPTLVGARKVFEFGQIPINDFSYLSNLNLAVAYENQRRLVFKQAEVSGVVLPLNPKFVKAAEGQAVATLDHLVVPPVGAGSIIYGGQNTSGNVLSLTDSVITKDLIAIYNFLESDVTTPGSDVYTTLNCISKTNKDKAAQLYANSPQDVFISGLGIPYLKGMVTINNDTDTPDGLGSVIKLPEVKEYQDLFYRKEGCTVDFWVHMPNLLASTLNTYYDSYWGTSTLHRIVFGCENTGGINQNLNPTYAQVDYGVETVRGLVCGFTRDRQIVNNLTPDSTNESNPVEASGIHFYIAPTRSINGSDVGFIRDTITVDCASPTYKTLKCSVPLTYEVSGKKFGDASGAFVHVAVVTAPLDNSVKIYLDGVLMTTSSIPEVFGVESFTAPKIPSFVQSNSFEYSLSSTGLSIFEDGPTVSSFTPWIIGSGFTDGAVNLGGFMGADSGIESGLKGFVGSFKFYSRALDSNEVDYNYRNQSPFFKNIQI